MSICLMACDEYENHDSSLEGVEPTSLVNSQQSYDHPEWIVSIHTPAGGGQDNYKCVGSLINENWILTAAHCVFDPDVNAPYLGPCAIDLDPADIEIYVGDYNIDEDQGDEVEIIPGEEKIVHEDFGGCFPTTNGWKNDIALIKLAWSAPIGPGVGTVAIANRPIPPGQNGRPGDAPIFGWGYYNHDNTSEFLEANELRTQIFDGRTRKLCNMNNADMFRNLTNRELCVGDENVYLENPPWTPGSLTTAFCHGDSGGPFLSWGFFTPPDDWEIWVDLEDNITVDGARFFVRGIVSWGGGDDWAACASSYGVLMDVGAYRSWIITNIYPDMAKFYDQVAAP